MLGIAPLFFALAQAADPHVIERWKVEMTEPLSGPDFQLIREASKHPEMKKRDLSCYHIRVVREKGVTTVAFLGDREPDRWVEEEDSSVLIIAGPNPRCPTRSFEMDKRGKVKSVIYPRH